MSNAHEASMHLPYFPLMTPNVLYGASAGKSNKFPMSGHPGGPGGSGELLFQTRRPTRYNAKPKSQTSKTWVHIVSPR